VIVVPGALLRRAADRPAVDAHLRAIGIILLSSGTLTIVRGLF
jgi:hypothetical protein